MSIGSIDFKNTIYRMDAEKKTRSTTQKGHSMVLLPWPRKKLYFLERLQQVDGIQEEAAW